MSEPTYLALDIGTKRIGLAVGSLIPFGRGTIDATDKTEALGLIKAVIDTEGVTTLIIGVPEVKSGDVTLSHTLALEWRDLLAQTTQLPIVMVNEAFSSQAAEQALRREGVDTHAHKERIDERAAELLLAQYLSESPNMSG